MKLFVDADPKNVAIIQELLSIWNINWGGLEDSDLVIAYEREPCEASKNVLLIPSQSFRFERWVKESNLTLKRTVKKPIHVDAWSVNLNFTPELTYEIMSDAPVNDNFYVLQFDFVEEYKRIMGQTLNARSSLLYKIATSLPVPYNVVPQKLRNSLMKKNDGYANANLLTVLPLDALRFALANGIEEVTKKRLSRKTWSNRSSACILTHDVETRVGLKKSVAIKKLEEKYDLPSVWFIPSKQYVLDQEIIQTLENNGEIGSHDTNHDGRLSNLSRQKLNNRLSTGRQSLERITNRSVKCFRAPLLQHTFDILSGLKESGFTYDMSIPTWEPKHPRTMGPHGIGTLFPTIIEGIKEIPLTMIQDHQLLHVLNLAPKDTITEWLSNIALIKSLGGYCVFLSHPEYGLLNEQGLPFYEELLNTLASDNELLVGLPCSMIHGD